MASFCNQCANFWGFEPDFAGFTTKEEWAEGYAKVVICEGCGVIQVDPEGYCVSDDCLGHGRPDYSELPKNNP